MMSFLRVIASNRLQNSAYCVTVGDIITLTLRTVAKVKPGGATGKECDEFPFARSHEGGRKNYEKGRVSVDAVLKNDNTRAGSLLWAPAPPTVQSQFSSQEGFCVRRRSGSRSRQNLRDLCGRTPNSHRRNTPDLHAAAWLRLRCLDTERLSAARCGAARRRHGRPRRPWRVRS